MMKSAAILDVDSIDHRPAVKVQPVYMDLAAKPYILYGIAPLALIIWVSNFNLGTFRMHCLTNITK